MSEAKSAGSPTPKVALITGASRGIGAAIARTLASDGLDLALTCVHQRAAADALAAELRDHGRRVWVMQFDVKDAAVSQTLALGGADPAKPDAVCTLDDADLASLATGKASARQLFQRGKLRIDGDVSVGHRLGFLKGLI